MRNYFLFILLLTPLFLAAQSGEPVTDTSYLEKQGSLFFEVRRMVYADGGEIQTRTSIGDTAQLVQAAKDRLTSKAATMAVDVRFVSQFRSQFTTLLRESDAVQALTGISPQREVQDEHAAPFLEDGWTIRRDATTSPVAFTVNAQGALRYAVNGGSTSPALLLGSAMRLRNYPSNGNFTDVYVLATGVWVSCDRSVVLRPPGNDAPVNRAAPLSAPKAAKKKG